MTQRKYTIILVDDEPEVRNRIASKIPEDVGFEVVGFAENGYDALELIEKLNPDVVLTDIKMPFIDGMELAKRIRLEYPKTKVAFISGYDEFEYAKEAIKLDVVGYLSKPISQDEILVFLNKLKSKLDEEYQMYFNQARLNRLFKSNISALVENQFNSLLSLSKIRNSDLEKFKLYNIDLFEGEFILGIIEFSEDDEFIYLEKLRIFLINLLRKKFKGDYNLYYFNNRYGLTFIIKGKQIDFLQIDSLLYEIYLTKKDFSNIRIRVGVSNIFSDFKEFSNAVKQAKEALSYNDCFNIGKIIYYSDIKNREKMALRLSKEEIEEISYTIKFKTDKEIKNLFKTLRKNYGALNQEYLLDKQEFIITLANLFIEFSDNLGVELDKVIDENIFDVLNKFENINELFQYLEELTNLIRDYNIKKSQSRVKSVLNEIIAYLDKNYKDPQISMDSVSNNLGISISYIAALFNKEMNITFNKYLVKMRMEKAMEMLIYTDKKIFEIATSVGYNDVYYFSHSFKKYTNKSPREYRNDKKA